MRVLSTAATVMQSLHILSSVMLKIKAFLHGEHPHTEHAISVHRPNICTKLGKALLILQDKEKQVPASARKSVTDVSAV